MAKAVIGAIEIGAGIVLLATTGPGLAPLAWGLIMAGAGEEAAFVAQELQGNPALTASAKLPAAPRECIYGMTRKGGTFIYQSTTGHQLNEVICWAACSCDSIVAMYIDQRKFYYVDGPSNASPYGAGAGDGTTYQDDSGNNYAFGSGTAAWHTLGNLWSAGAWSSGMTATRTQSGDTASTFYATVIGVTIAGTTYVFGCLVGGTAGSSSSVFSSSNFAGALVTDGGITWVNLGPTPGGFWFDALNAQDTAQWLNSCLCVNLCATYFKATYNSNVFSGPPQLRATIKGRNDIYDPRTSTYGFTTNAALCIAAHIVDPVFGFGATPGSPEATALWASVYDGVFGDQLIAAANICDEQVQLATASQSGNPGPWQPWHTYTIGDQFTQSGATWTVIISYTSEAYFGQAEFAGSPTISQDVTGPVYESRYTLNGYFNSDQEPGQILSSMLMACEGRITRQGGGYLIYPAAWYGTSLDFGPNDLAGAVKWQPSRKFRDRINCVRATFVCPQYPYNQVGYTYDNKNNDVFNGEWQPTDAPPYAQDYLHGYGAITDPGQGDANLVQDGGVRLYQDRKYQFVISVSQCQRLMKIYLLRNRFAGSGTFPMKLSALQAQCQDVMNFTFSYLNMLDTYLEVMKFDWKYEEADGGGGEGAKAVMLSTQLELQLTDPSVYDWAPTEELTLYDQPSPALENPFQVSPPTSVTATSGLSTALVAPDGTVTPRIEVQWTEPSDPYVTSGGSIQGQITPHGAGTWVDCFMLAGTAEIAFIGNVVTGQAYDVQIRSVRADGTFSVWVEVSDVICGIAVNATGLNPVAPDGTLTAVTTSAVASTIFIASFTASLAGFTASCAPTPTSLTGLTPQQLYYVYFIDPTFAGGTITPIATLNASDFLNLPGYFLIGSILTPTWISGGGGRYSPSNYVNNGMTSPITPANAFDNNLATYADIYSLGGGSSGFGDVLYEDFPAVLSASGQLLYVNAQIVNPSGAWWAITACIGSSGVKPAGPLGTSGGGYTLSNRGAWAATTAYAQWDYFTNGGLTYLVVTGYTSGASFGSTDVGNCCYMLAVGRGAAAQTTYSIALPTSTPLSGVTVDVTADQGGCYVDVFGIYIQ